MFTHRIPAPLLVRVFIWNFVEPRYMRPLLISSRLDSAWSRDHDRVMYRSRPINSRGSRWNDGSYRSCDPSVHGRILEYIHMTDYCIICIDWGFVQVLVLVHLMYKLYWKVLVLISVQSVSAADRKGQRQMQLNRCRRKSPDGVIRQSSDRTNTSTMYHRLLLVYDYVICRLGCGVQWNQQICVWLSCSCKLCYHFVYL